MMPSLISILKTTLGAKVIYLIPQIEFETKNCHLYFAYLSAVGEN